MVALGRPWSQVVTRGVSGGPLTGADGRGETRVDAGPTTLRVLGVLPDESNDRLYSAW